MKKYLALIDWKTRIVCIIVILAAAVGALLSARWPILLSNVYEMVGKSTFAEGLIAIGVFAVVFFLAEVLNHIRRLITDCMILQQESTLRLRCLRKMLRMPAEYFAHSLSGEINARMNQSVSGFSQLIKLACNDVFPAILTSVTVIVTVIAHAPLLLSFVMIGYMMISIVISFFQIRSQNGMREKIMHQKNELDGMFCQSVKNT